MPPAPNWSNPSQRLQARHWQRTRRLTWQLLLLWIGTGFVSMFYARELATITIFGWPLSFYIAAQGAALVSLLIIVLYAWRMRQCERALALALAQEDGQ